MGGCISPPTKKVKPPPASTKKPINADSLNTTLDNLKPTPSNYKSVPQVAKPKFKRMDAQQLIRDYRIQQNIGTTTRAQGPKYISNYSDGTGKIMRILSTAVQNSNLFGSTGNNNNMSIEERVKVYEEVLGLDVAQDQQGNIVLMQEYYCGPYLYQISMQENQEQIRKFLSQVYQIIDTFHQRNVVLGNITIFSFRMTSQFNPTVRLVELNLNGGSQQAMGNAFKSQKSHDWQSFAFIVQSVLVPQPPIFIAHKLQYIQNCNNTVSTLLKGKKIKRQQLDNLKYIKSNQNIINGYRFRNDINKLMKLRKRRVPHREIYYSQDFRDQSGQRLADQNLQRMETLRVIQRVQEYIDKINQQTQQPFIMYSTYNESLKKLKGVFSINQPMKKMEQFKQTLVMIK